MADVSIFDAARRKVKIEDLISKDIKLRRAGRELRGQCPLCGAGAKSASPPFAINPDKQTFRMYCAGCDLYGDVIDLERALRGGTLWEAARRIVGEEFVAEDKGEAKKRVEKPAAPRSSDLMAVELWKSAQPSIKGTLAERYLRNRGISGAVLEAVMASPHLRYHPHAKWGWLADRREWLLAPAMLVRVVTARGPTGGIHATYLSRIGWKADLEPAKRMWGPQNDADGRPGGAWLIGPDGAGDLVCAEGIETALSVAMLAARSGRPMRCCAALSLGRLQGGLAKDDDGCIDPFDPKPDLERGPFVWPAPAQNPWGAVIIAVDRDMKPIKVKARTPRGRICEYRLEGEARARLSGRLATAAWLRAGAASARAIAPPPGFDFNNELQRVLRGAA